MLRRMLRIEKPKRHEHNDQNGAPPLVGKKGSSDHAFPKIRMTIDKLPSCRDEPYLNPCPRATRWASERAVLTFARGKVLAVVDLYKREILRSSTYTRVENVSVSQVFCLSFVASFAQKECIIIIIPILDSDSI